MSRDWQRDVKDFHEKCGLEVNDLPSLPSEDTVNLRIKLIAEEVNEELLPFLSDLSKKGAWDSETFTDDLATLADGLTDSIYVILGTAVSFGIDLQPIWDAIQKANMLKSGGQVRGDGKILKPEGWKHPDIKKLIEEQLTR